MTKHCWRKSQSIEIEKMEGFRESKTVMDRSLFEKAVKLHGVKLERLVKEEQGASFLVLDHVDVKDVPQVENSVKTSGLSTSSLKLKHERKRSMDETSGKQFIDKLHGFIARKADLLFQQQGNEDQPLKESSPVKDAEKSDYYAILPPLEQFLEVHPDVCQERLFDVLKVGDVVVGQILSTKEFGIFAKLLALCRDTFRFLEECEVVALLPAAELRDKFSHVASVDDFQIGDLLRALVIKINPVEQKVIISLHSKDDSGDNGSLGLITESELPVHYRRSVLQMNTQETYEDMLHNTVGFDNPFNVANLGAKLGLNDACPLSLMRGLQRSNFPEKEYAEPLRKWQTNRWSMESVAKGVAYFKAGQLLDAMQHLNKALEIDEENVEALVARGALYANKDLLSKALQDFGKALKINPNHRNANKYMCETLIERGKQHEEAGEIEKAVDCYQTATDIKPDFLEAQLCLEKINRTRTPINKVASPESISSPSLTSPEVMSVEALRQLVDPKDNISKTKRISEKTKKKKKKKKQEKDKSSRKRDNEGTPPGRSQSKKRGRYSSAESSQSSRSRSRSRHRSRKKSSGDSRKYERSTSRKRKKKARGRRSHESVSCSRSDSSDRSLLRRSMSRSQQRSARKASKYAKKHRRRQSSSYSRSSSSSSQSYRSRSRSRSRKIKASTRHGKSSSKRKLDVVQHSSRYSVSRSRSQSPYTVSDSSSTSESPRRSNSRSLDQSRSRSRKDKTGKRSSTGKSKTTERSRSRSLSAGTRRRTLSAGSQKSRITKIESTKIGGTALLAEKFEAVSDVQERMKENTTSKSKTFKTDSKQLSSGADRRDTYPSDERYKSKHSKKTEMPIAKGPLKRNQDAQKLSVDEALRTPEKGRGLREREEAAKVKLKDSKCELQSRRRFTETRERRSVEESRRRRYSYSDSESISDNSEDEHKKHLKETASQRSSFSSTSQKAQSIDRSKKGQPGSQGGKPQDRKGKDRKSSSCKDRHYRQSSSRSASSDETYSSGTSYSSYSVSGSRSYSYSSYSSSGSYSDSDESCSHQKDSDKKSRTKKNRRASLEAQEKSKTSKLKEVKSRQSKDEEDDSESDVDTGIYEISRDHLEMYMDSKSYQLKKADVSPLKHRKRWRSGDEDEIVSDKKMKAGQRRGKNPPDDGKKEKTPSFVAKSKESQKTSKLQSIVPQKSDTKVPLSAPSHLPPVSKSAVSNVNIFQSGAPDDGRHQSMRPSQERPGQLAQFDRTPDQTGGTDKSHQQQQLVPGIPKPSISEAKNRGSKSVLIPSQDRGKSYHTTPHETAYEPGPSHRGQVFTPEQLSVIKSISKHLAQTHQTVSHVGTSVMPVDTDKSQYYKKDQEDQGQGSSEITNQSRSVQGHQIGVIMTERPSDTFVQSEYHQEISERSDPPLDEPQCRSKRGRWDVRVPDKDGGLDSGHARGSSLAHVGSKPIPVSIDYKHGKDTSSSYDNNSKGYREREVIVSDMPRASAHERFVYRTHDLDHTGGKLLEVGRDPYEISQQETDDTSRHRGHHSRDGRSQNERVRGKRSEGSMCETRLDVVESNDIYATRSGDRVQVVDYQHGKGDRYHEKHRSARDERNLDDRHESRHHSRHHDRQHERHSDRHYGDHQRSLDQRHSDSRRICEPGSADRRHYHGRDRHRDTHRDRYHGRSSDKYRDATPVAPKESNPFHQLVSSSKDMQVAALHSEGKWGHDGSPEDMKSSRLWWL
ncbi:uncharacterized protein LOC110980955 [Acanthaster planci]|uniref:Uncharacterized protein LOC110980955 n=1 Tax=Acanthaster planci TaxID=133434 RepID=A0A8B7YMR1_ACAPL|nr:uncharacterized protein LOC110980955 [Acanthaster planci]